MTDSAVTLERALRGELSIARKAAQMKVNAVVPGSVAEQWYEVGRRENEYVRVAFLNLLGDAFEDVSRARFLQLGRDAD
jgi:hypothetical protein